MNVVDVTISVFWTKYIIANELERAEILKTKTMIGKLHKSIAAMPNDELKQHIVISEVQSYIDDLIDYYEAKYGEK